MTENMICDLGDGLVLRSAVAADADALSDFNSRVHSDRGWDEPDEHVGMWVRDLMLKPHPTFKTEDFLVVEDTNSGAIVSSTNLISQTWSYAGIEIPVGRPELVGTHPDYRNRGLIRAQFETLHRWSAERGHKMQAITGIPYYYRQFGYEMTVDLHGGYSGPLTSVPRLKDDESESYTVRPATPDDIPFLREVDAHAAQQHVLHCARDAALWRYEIEGKTPSNCSFEPPSIIVDADGAPVGYLRHPTVLWGNTLALLSYELKEGASWWDVTPGVLRYLKDKGATYKPYFESEDGPSFERLMFVLGGEHPSYPIVSQDWLPRFRRPYSWYIRVPDLPDFLRTVAPVLEARLARSVMVGYSGELHLNFYRDGLKMTFEKGCLVDVQGCEPANTSSTTEFPPLTFLQVLFGARSFSALTEIFPDCGGRLESRLLLSALFPEQESNVWPVA